MEGWIRVYRKMLANPVVMKDAEHLAVWVWLLLNATHTPYDTLFGGVKVTLSKGQLVTGRVKIAQALKISESKVERILKCFESEQQIEQQKSNKNRLITLVNWNKYQRSEQQIEQQLNNNRTTTEQQLNTNNNINNNTENEKNEKKNNNIPPSPLRGEKPKAEKKSNVKMFNGFMDANQNNGLSEKVRNALLDWMEYKDQRKDYYADKGMQSLLNKALNKEKEYGADAVVEVIGDSMASNYQGITWDALEKRKSKKLVTSTQDEWDEWRARREKEKNG